MQCTKHLFELAADVCAWCGQLWCGSCLTYVEGERAEPMCVTCALVRSGVRPGKLRPVPRRHVRRRREELRRYLAVAPSAVQVLPDLQLPGDVLT